MVIQPEYDRVGWFSDGLAMVSVDKRKGFIDIHGNIVVPIDFNSVRSFRHGLSNVGVGGYSDKTGWSGYINTSGEFIWRPDDYAQRDEARALAEIKSVNLMTEFQPGVEGLVVRNKKKIDINGPKGSNNYYCF